MHFEKKQKYFQILTDFYNEASSGLWQANSKMAPHSGIHAIVKFLPFRSE